MVETVEGQAARCCRWHAGESGTHRATGAVGRAHRGYYGRRIERHLLVFLPGLLLLAAFVPLEFLLFGDEARVHAEAQLHRIEHPVGACQLGAKALEGVERGRGLHDDDGECEQCLGLFAVCAHIWVLGHGAAFREVPGRARLGVSGIGRIAACLAACRHDVNGDQSHVDEHRHGRKEEVQGMSGELDDQEKRAEDAQDEVIMGDANPVSEDLYAEGVGVYQKVTTYKSLHTIGALYGR